MHVAYLGDGSSRRVTLCNEDRCGLFETVVAFGIIEMDLTVAQFAVVEVDFLGSLTGRFCHSGHGFAVAFACLHLGQHDFRSVFVAVQVVVEFAFYEVTDEFSHGGAVGTHVARAEFGFCL